MTYCFSLSFDSHTSYKVNSPESLKNLTLTLKANQGNLSLKVTVRWRFHIDISVEVTRAVWLVHTYLSAPGLPLVSSMYWRRAERNSSSFPLATSTLRCWSRYCVTQQTCIWVIRYQTLLMLNLDILTYLTIAKPFQFLGFKKKCLLIQLGIILD